ncbi:MAG: hypothetical protein WAK88_07230 [Candidatus Cybelea sp.]
MLFFPIPLASAWEKANSVLNQVVLQTAIFGGTVRHSEIVQIANGLAVVPGLSKQR